MMQLGCDGGTSIFSEVELQLKVLLSVRWLRNIPR